MVTDNKRFFPLEFVKEDNLGGIFFFKENENAQDENGELFHPLRDYIEMLEPDSEKQVREYWSAIKTLADKKKQREYYDLFRKDGSAENFLEKADKEFGLDFLKNLIDKVNSDRKEKSKMPVLKSVCDNVRLESCCGIRGNYFFPLIYDRDAKIYHPYKKMIVSKENKASISMGSQSKKIHRAAFKFKDGTYNYFKSPIEYLPHCNYVYYTLHLSIGMYMLEKMGFKPNALWLIHKETFKNGKTKNTVLKVPYARHEAINILKWITELRTPKIV